MKKSALIGLFTFAALLASMPAAAYIGPGAGISLLGAIWAVIAAVLFAIGGLLIWPIKLVWRRLRGPAATEEMPNPGQTRADQESGKSD